MENNNMKPVDKWGRRVRRFGLILLSIIAAIVITVIIGVWQYEVNNAAPPWLDYVGNGLFVIGAVAMLGFVVSKFVLFLTKLRAKKENYENITEPEKIRPVGWRAHKKLIFAGGVILIILLTVLFSFWPKDCKDVGCFVAAANNGQAANFQSTDKAGTEWKYQIARNFSGDLIFTKTLLRLNNTEPQFMKDFLQGKKLICKLPDNFDERLVTSLFYGVGDNCSGDLKENLGQLLFLLN